MSRDSGGAVEKRPSARARRLRRLLLVVAAVVVVVAGGTIAKLRLQRGEHLEEMPLLKPGERTLIVAPHEDDESLGCAGYMQQARLAGAEVFVCFMTAGEGEELGAIWNTKRPPSRPRAFILLGQKRHKEAARTLSRIGVGQDHIFFLNYPNMGVDKIWSAQYWTPAQPWTSPFTRTSRAPFANTYTPQAVFCGSACVSDLTAIMERVRPATVFTTHPSDIHPDHWPTYGFAKLALERVRLRQPWAKETRLFTYVVHRRGWPVPWGYYPRLPLMPPQSLVNLPVNKWLILHLNGAEVRIKNAMILTYRSQMARFDLLLRAFARQTEVFAEVRDIGFPRNILGYLLSEEPTSESRYLHEHPQADLASVEASQSDENLEVTVQTTRPLSRHYALLVTLHGVGRSTAASQVITCRYQPERAPEVVVAGGEGPPVASDALAQAIVQDGQEVRFTFPLSMFGGVEGLMVDAMTQIQNRYPDHGVTRMLRWRLPVTPAPSR
ncbi:MAG: PIG-L deacetylase family protein [Armatimonadia bacterium]